MQKVYGKPSSRRARLLKPGSCWKLFLKTPIDSMGQGPQGLGISSLQRDQVLTGIGVMPISCFSLICSFELLRKSKWVFDEFCHQLTENVEFIRLAPESSVWCVEALTPKRGVAILHVGVLSSWAKSSVKGR